LLKAISDTPVQFADDAKFKHNAAQLLDEIKDRQRYTLSHRSLEKNSPQLV
jgi:hypothetical protein